MLRTVAFAGLLAFLRCSNPSPSPEQVEAETETETETESASGETPQAATPDEHQQEDDQAANDPPQGFNRAILGAYISLGDPSSAFPPGRVSYLRSGPSPYLLVTPKLTENGPAGYQVEMKLPDSAGGPLSAEDLEVVVNDESGNPVPVSGQVTVRALDFSTGHVALVVDGQTQSDPALSVEVEIDARLRVIQQP